MPRKLLDVSRLHALGWRHRIGLREGIASTYQWFLEHHEVLRQSSVAAAVHVGPR
jgi:GDP-L-fucose synthase